MVQLGSEDWQGENWGFGYKIALSDDGKWDAAFERTRHKPVGCGIKNTPFGKTFYDYPYNNPKILRYEDIIDGFFYKLFYEFTCTRGLPGIVNEDFASVMIQRGIIAGLYNEEEEYNPQDEIDDWENFCAFECEKYGALRKHMEGRLQ